MQVCAAGGVVKAHLLANANAEKGTNGVRPMRNDRFRLPFRLKVSLL
jgi:hypothetical protein